MPIETASPQQEVAWALSLSVVENVLGAALAAHRAGALADFLAARRLATKWYTRHFLRAVHGTAGDRLGADAIAATELLLRWTISQLRPDRQSDAAPIDRACWLDRTSWRPFLAVLCHQGLARIPEFNDRYRRSPQESAMENLCGIWSIGPSTFYRYLDKGRRQMASALLDLARSGEKMLSLRSHVHEVLAIPAGAAEPADGTAWHRTQTAHAIAQRDPCSALWHCGMALDIEGFAGVLRRFRLELAREPETDLMTDRLLAQAPPTRHGVDLLIAQGALWSARRADERERLAYERALRMALAAGDPLMLGIVYGALGKFHESRDAHKALACLEDSADFLRRAHEACDPTQNAEARNEYVAALQKLAWFHILRNDPRSRTLLDRADAIPKTPPLPDEMAALIEQAWGEYWRRSGNLKVAVEHQHRALNIFERLADARQVLSTYNNLSIVYGEAKEFERAIDYAQRVLSMATHTPVEPYIVAGTHINLGAACYWQGNYDDAIEQYQLALESSRAANLPVIAHRATFNLAEAHYKRFHVHGDPADELAGDRWAAATLAADPQAGDSFLHDATRTLKAEILGRDEGATYQKLVPEEFASHYDELSQVQLHRAALAVPDRPEKHIRAHLAIANAYLAISTKEREAALELIRQHGLDHEFDSEIDALQMTFSRELTKEKVLHAQWKQKSYGVLTEERASSVLRQVLEAGSINKSGYAQLCQVGLATASKHLGTLAERGLLVQMGKGPSTRYVLPAA